MESTILKVHKLTLTNEDNKELCKEQGMAVQSPHFGMEFDCYDFEEPFPAKDTRRTIKQLREKRQNMIKKQSAIHRNLDKIEQNNLKLFERHLHQIHQLRNDIEHHWELIEDDLEKIQNNRTKLAQRLKYLAEDIKDADQQMWNKHAGQMIFSLLKKNAELKAENQSLKQELGMHSHNDDVPYD